MPNFGRRVETKPCALLIIYSQMNSASAQLEKEGNVSDRVIFGKMRTDDDGWPLLEFVPDDESLNTVAAFLQDDVDIMLPCCDELLQAMRSVLEGREEEWTWNGNRFLVRVRRDHAHLTDKYGEVSSNKVPVSIGTSLLAQIVGAWRDFVAELPRQREFANSRGG